MINITLDNIKEFMSHLFIKDTFDQFLCKSIDIDTFVPFRIEGSIMTDFLNDIEKEELKGCRYIPWVMLKPYCFNIIKGSRTPLSMKAVFAAPDNSIEGFISRNALNIPPNMVSGLYINIRYEKKNLNIITGTSLSTFTPDKSVEQAWDEAVSRFIKTI